MNYGQNIAYSLVAGTAFTQYVGVTAAGLIATTGLNFHGVVQNKPEAGDHMTVVALGESKVLCGSGGLTAADPVTVVASGYFAKCNSGYYLIGRCITAAASGGIANVFVGGNPAYI